MRQLLNSYTTLVKVAVLTVFVMALSFVIASEYGDSSSYIDDYERVRITQVHDFFDNPDSPADSEYTFGALSFGEFQLLIPQLTTYLTGKKAACPHSSLFYRLHARAPPLL